MFPVVAEREMSPLVVLRLDDLMERSVFVAMVRSLAKFRLLKTSFSEVELPSTRSLVFPKVLSLPQVPPPILATSFKSPPRTTSITCNTCPTTGI